MQINKQLLRATDSEAVLALVETHYEQLNAVNVATALHRIAARNKKKRARRDVVLRDRRFALVIDALADHSSEQFKSTARSVADVLWSFATLDYFPSQLLTPILTSLNIQLDRRAFEAQQTSIIVWSLARLECKPVRLLEKLEDLALEQLGEMTTQNVANLLWGFAKLQYQPSKLLPPLSAALASSDLLPDAKPVEIADTAYALARLAKTGEHEPLLQALAASASSGGKLDAFSSRQLVTLIAAFARLDAAAAIPTGRLDEWVAAVRAAHETTPLLIADANALEAALTTLGRDAAWIKSVEILSAWNDLSAGRDRRGQPRQYTDDELRTVFTSIDTDGSGDIDLSELTAAIKAISPNADDKAVAEMLTFADADGDANVDFEEFKAIILGRATK